MHHKWNLTCLFQWLPMRGSWLWERKTYEWSDVDMKMKPSDKNDNELVSYPPKVNFSTVLSSI